MRLAVYRATDAHQLPPALIRVLDDLDDRFLAAFHNYPNSIKLVVAAWGTTGTATDQPIGALIATADQIITGYVDLLPEYDDGPLDEDEAAGEDDNTIDSPSHQEPNAAHVLKALLARLRRVSKAIWFLVHDADEIESWIEQGFVVVELPPTIPAEQAVRVLAWGKFPEDVATLLHVRHLSWRRNLHRGFVNEGF